MRYSSSTDVGVRRSSNEDAYLANGTVFAVADGMGGHLAGEVASGIAIDCLGDLGGARASERTLLNRFERANTIIYDRARADADRRGMGTTLTACLVDENRLYIGHVGDSRLYRLRGGRLKQLTKDHSLVAQMVEHGHIRPEEAADHPQRSVITRALGAAIDVKVDTKTKEMAAGDRYLLATDGLTTGVTDPEIASIIAGEDDLDAAARRLIALANQRGGVDNVTVVLFESQVVDRRKDERGFRIGTKGLIAALLIVLVILGAWGTWSYLSSGIYLGEHNGKVAIYRGVPGSFLSVKMSHLVKETTVRTDSLPEPYRDRLAQGLPSKSLQDAEKTVRGYESLGRERR